MRQRSPGGKAQSWGCLPAGVPRINYVTPYNEYRILQKPGAVVIFAEWNHSARVIPIDGRPRLDDRVRGIRQRT